MNSERGKKNICTLIEGQDLYVRFNSSRGRLHREGRLVVEAGRGEGAAQHAMGIVQLPRRAAVERHLG